MHNGIVHFFAGAEEIKGSTLDRTASPASKAFNGLARVACVARVT